jgi:uncharacterized protein YggE
VTTTLPATRPGIRWLAGGLAIGLLAAALAGPAVGAAQAQSDPSDQDTVRSINVNGMGRVKAEPDVADINLGVTKQGEDAASASQEAATAMDAVVTALLEAGVAEGDIQTSSISLNPLYDWDNSPPDIEGWEASNLVNITVRDIATVGDVVDAATAAGATNINGITFRVEDPTAAEAEARSAAIADARAKAEQLATDAGVTITGVISITESGGQAPEPIFYAQAEMAMAAGDAMAKTPVMPGQVELSITVIVQYEISG